MPQTAPGRNDEYHALPCGRDKGTRRPDRPGGVSKAGESQPTESNLTSANGQDLGRGRRPPSPKAPKPSRTEREIWLTPALCKIAAAKQDQCTAESHPAAKGDASISTQRYKDSSARR